MHDPEVRQRDGHVDVVAAKLALLDRERALEEVVRLRVVAEDAAHVPEIHQRDGHLDGVAAVLALLDRERALDAHQCIFGSSGKEMAPS